jgi:hypothetical protein
MIQAEMIIIDSATNWIEHQKSSKGKKRQKEKHGLPDCSRICSPEDSAYAPPAW